MEKPSPSKINNHMNVTTVDSTRQRQIVIDKCKEIEEEMTSPEFRHLKVKR